MSVLKLEAYRNLSPMKKDKGCSKTAREAWAGWCAHAEAAPSQRLTSMYKSTITFYTGFEVWMLVLHSDLC